MVPRDRQNLGQWTRYSLTLNGNVLGVLFYGYARVELSAEFLIRLGRFHTTPITWQILINLVASDRHSQLQNHHLDCSGLNGIRKRHAAFRWRLLVNCGYSDLTGKGLFRQRWLDLLLSDSAKSAHRLLCDSTMLGLCQHLLNCSDDFHLAREILSLIRPVFTNNTHL